MSPNAQSILMCVNFPKKIEMKHFLFLLVLLLLFHWVFSLPLLPLFMFDWGDFISVPVGIVKHTVQKYVTLSYCKAATCQLACRVVRIRQSITCDRPKGLICDQTFRPNSARWFSTGEKCLCGPYFEQSVTVWLKEEKKGFLIVECIFFSFITFYYTQINCEILN